MECCILYVWRGPCAGREGAGLGRGDFFRLGFISKPSKAIRELLCPAKGYFPVPGWDSGPGWASNKPGDFFNVSE